MVTDEVARQAQVKRTGVIETAVIQNGTTGTVGWLSTPLATASLLLDGYPPADAMRPWEIQDNFLRDFHRLLSQQPCSTLWKAAP
jgi:hypothetical protein